jgi:hypothetical protein
MYFDALGGGPPVNTRHPPMVEAIGCCYAVPGSALERER